MLPAGIQLVTVTMGPALDFQGVPLAGSVTFTPSTAIVWAATGAPIFPRPVRVELDAAGMGSVALPATDQPGFIDGAGHALKDWTYRTVWTLADSSIPQPAPFFVALPAASTTIDLDLLIPLEGSGGVTVALPAVTSVNGMTGAVTIAGGVASVAGKTGAVSLVKGDVGLGNVDNTSDAGKPISTATATALAAKADLVGGVIPTAQLPALAVNDVFTVATQAAMLALNAQRGDLAVRTDNLHRYMLAADAPGTLANWIDLGMPTGEVLTVNGQAGAVVLAAADVGAVPTSRKVAGKALTGDVSIAFGDLAGAAALSQQPPGTPFVVEKVGADWTYNGAVITAKPAGTASLRMFAVSSDGSVPPFMADGDFAFAAS